MRIRQTSEQLKGRVEKACAELRAVKPLASKRDPEVPLFDLITREHQLRQYKRPPKYLTLKVVAEHLGENYNSLRSAMHRRGICWAEIREAFKRPPTFFEKYGAAMLRGLARGGMAGIIENRGSNGANLCR